ncbi:hypothetical protein B0H10DRAFT_864610 [Mycena sp. CBHHK59/15]|nr:hypothetical protein B0H10DRAFT_864610 [Mycena sp. CBHHK59/15]
MPPHASRAAPQWNRTGHESQPSFSAVVHGRVRELTGGHEKRLPPTPMSPGYASSNSDLVALVQVSAALERRLVAGDLPDDALRRMSAVAAMPTGRGAFVPAHAPAAASGLYHGAAPAPSHADDVHGKPKHTFRNPLARSRLKGNAKQHKEDVALAAPFSLDHYHAPGETPPPPPPKSPPQNNPHLSGWRRFANTSRGTHHAPAVPG